LFGAAASALNDILSNWKKYLLIYVIVSVVWGIGFKGFAKALGFIGSWFPEGSRVRLWFEARQAGIQKLVLDADSVKGLQDAMPEPSDINDKAKMNSQKGREEAKAAKQREERSEGNLNEGNVHLYQEATLNDQHYYIGDEDKFKRYVELKGKGISDTDIKNTLGLGDQDLIKLSSLDPPKIRYGRGPEIDSTNATDEGKWWGNRLQELGKQGKINVGDPVAQGDRPGGKPEIPFFVE
jgi:hypothetical protein